MIEELKQAVEFIAEKLEKPSAEVYRILMQQAEVDGWVYLSQGIFSLACLLMCLGGIFWGIKKCRDCDYEDDFPIGVIDCSVLIGFFSLVGVMWNLGGTELYTALFNPEYYALQKLLGGLR